MKKLFVISLTVFFFLPLVKQNHSDASQNGIPLKHYQSISFFMSKELISNYKILEEIIILPETHFNETEAIQMITRISNINTHLLEKLRDENIQVVLFTGKLTDLPSASHLKGEKPRGYSENGPTWDEVPGIGGSRVILAKVGNSHKGEGHGSANLELHEIAHTFDRLVFGEVRNDPEFKKIWIEEADKLFPNQNYFISFPEEYFAEAFVYYFLSEQTSKELKAKAPLTYSYFFNLFQRNVENSDR
ncbi:anthrax toxin lethal factor-related metalloendopeptidase [Litchfieldia alkalitelluris]|uniref:anthrax toxin lethal factor-related metalloendopeptidase n=1 Tax=Litchfieldia alkalitelluris TaxID=304268 RepID=UPI000996A5B5|nr:toxin [Litchfieldia alkalitelluris]